MECSKCGGRHNLKAAPGTDVIFCPKCADEYERLHDALVDAVGISVVELRQIAVYAVAGRAVLVLTRGNATANRIGRVVMNTGYEVISIKRDKVIELPL